MKEEKETLYSAGLNVGENKETDWNYFGFGVRTTPKGSMQQDIFLDYAAHFVKHLPPDQGKGKCPVVLILDGHSSRWTISALEYFTENNVWPFFLPSHSSIITQPNDCGVNMDVHYYIAEVANELSNIMTRCSVTNLNVIFRLGWERFIKNERKKLTNEGCNNTTIGWRNVGYNPFNKFCPNWDIELNKIKGYENMLCDNHHNKEGLLCEMYEVIPNDDQEKSSSFSFTSNGERASFFEGYECYKNGKGAVTRVAYLRAKRMLKIWREKNDPRTKIDDMATDVGDRIAMSLMKFIKTGEYASEYNVQSLIGKDISNVVKNRLKMYLSGIKPIIETVPVSIKKEDQSIDGVISKRCNGLFRIEMINEEVMDDMSLDDILGDECIKINIIDQYKSTEMKRIANLKEIYEEKQSNGVGKTRYRGMLMTEYERLCEIIKKGALNDFTYENFLILCAVN